jgi:hypothetical protein
MEVNFKRRWFGGDVVHFKLIFFTLQDLVPEFIVFFALS